MKARRRLLRLVAPWLGALLMAGSDATGIVPPIAAGTGRAGAYVDAQLLDTIGTGDILYGSRVLFQGDASPMTGDVYAETAVGFQQYRKSPLCDSRATATHLAGPQVLAGTTIGVTAVGPRVTPSCGGPAVVNVVPYAYECANNSLTEVAPTSCPTAGGRSPNLPVNWHPMTPIGMDSTDFTFIAQAPRGQLPAGVSIARATRNGVGVAYTPASYAPPYWTTDLAARGKVMLIEAALPFCVNVSRGYPSGLTSPTPLPDGVCPASFNYYGDYNQSPPPGIQGANTTRFLDWGLVADDLSRGTARTFFQAPARTSIRAPSCVSCDPRGNPNGVRYIPLLPPVNVLAQACARNVTPGVNVFDEATEPRGLLCPAPVETTSTTRVSFSGTRASPESLVIDNPGVMVSISGTISGRPLACANHQFNAYNSGLILATGDLALTGNLAFSGVLYTRGSIFLSGPVVLRGGVFAAGLRGGAPPASSAVMGLDTTGTVAYCAP